MEHYWKSLIHDGDSVSVHRPGFYASRFQKFMKEKVFKKQVCAGSGAGCSGSGGAGPSSALNNAGGGAGGSGAAVSGGGGGGRHAASNVSFRRSQQFKRTISNGDKGGPSADEAPVMSGVSANPAGTSATGPLRVPPERGTIQEILDQTWWFYKLPMGRTLDPNSMDRNF